MSALRRHDQAIGTKSPLDPRGQARQAESHARRPVVRRPAFRSIGRAIMPLPDLRETIILAELAKHGRIFVKDLAAHLSVSRETIRRDLKELELDGKLRCTYGGAIRTQSGGDQPVSLRMRVNAREKAKIASLAAPLVRDDTTIFIDAGTTTLAFARALVDRDRVRVVTNSLDIAQLLVGSSVAETIVVSGRLVPEYRAMFGPLTLEAAANFVFDAVFISIAAVDEAHGFMDFGGEEAALRRTLVRHAREVVMLADSAKFGRIGTIKTLDFRHVDRLVTDTKPAASYLAAFDEAGIETVYA